MQQSSMMFLHRDHATVASTAAEGGRCHETAKHDFWFRVIPPTWPCSCVGDQNRKAFHATTTSDDCSKLYKRMDA